MAKLTVKQQRFADEYIICGNATEAAKKAGYSKKTARFIGNENLTKPNIKTYIDSRLKELEDKQIAKQDEIMKYLTSIMRGEQQEQVLRGMGEGFQEIDDMDVSAKDRIKAAELLGKRYALWTDKTELSGAVGMVQIIDDIPEGEENAGD
ncbi:phage terminase small subunit [Alkalibacterium putridalgicola]|uniref:Terminase small subunit n=1 Tax=Alkalibacterium putridalgicola TaxID=426703 RepID=A0A1H7RL94_9LACT|nr:terminase small subunit [Alkalibacterium putridalgicola]GEK88894.1 terminase small subunit [Alkalibacterium putridalgicola]SEL61016.1 phage terminase small subunit [Alkalibacterium putridalgicola]